MNMDSAKLSLTISVLALIVGGVAVSLAYSNLSTLENKLGSEVSRLDKSIKEATTKADNLATKTDSIAKSSEALASEQKTIRSLIEKEISSLSGALKEAEAARKAEAERIKTLEEQQKAREQLEAKIAAARAEGTVLVYGSIDANEFVRISDAFMKKYPGIKVEYVRGSPTEIYTRVTTELAAKKPSADIVAPALPGSLTFQREGYLRNYVSPESKVLPKETLDPKGQITAIVANAQIFMYNTNLVPKDQVPKTLEDIANTKWKGKVVSHDLRIGTTASQFFASLTAVFGQDRITNFLRQLKQNVDPVLNPSTSGAADTVVRGEYAIGLVTQLHDVIRLKQAGAPVDVLRIEGMPLMVTPVTAAILKTAVHNNAAELLIYYMLSVEAQTIIGNIDVRFPVRSDVTAKWTTEKALPGIKQFYYPTEEADTNLKKYTDLYKQIFG